MFFRRFPHRRVFSPDIRMDKGCIHAVPHRYRLLPTVMLPPTNQINLIHSFISHLKEVAASVCCYSLCRYLQQIREGNGLGADLDAFPNQIDLTDCSGDLAICFVVF